MKTKSLNVGLDEETDSPQLTCFRGLYENPSPSGPSTYIGYVASADPHPHRLTIGANNRDNSLAQRFLEGSATGTEISGFEDTSRLNPDNNCVSC